MSVYNIDPTWLHRYPRWFRRAVSEASKRHSLPKILRGPWSNCDAINWVMERDCGYSTRNEPRIVDHWGSERDRLILEPYATADDPKFITAVQRLADLLGCEFSISADAATWFPGRTVRVELWPKVQE